MRWRGVGGWGAAATIMRAIAVGGLSLETREGSLSIRLVPGIATPKRHSPSRPFVERGHVEGLADFDRQLLTMLFDDIARSVTLNLAAVSHYRNSHPVEYWNRLRRWRQVVDAEASRLKELGRLQVDRRLIDQARKLIVDSLYDADLTDADWARLAPVGLVAGLDDVVVKSAARRRAGHAGGWHTGPGAVASLALVRSGKRSGVDVLRRLFSPLRPSGYAPAQYTKLVLPPMGSGRSRFVDDGVTRLGG